MIYQLHSTEVKHLEDPRRNKLASNVRCSGTIDEEADVTLTPAAIVSLQCNTCQQLSDSVSSLGTDSNCCEFSDAEKIWIPLMIICSFYHRTITVQ